MNKDGYHEIHCPVCGGVVDPGDVKFSISEFVDEIFKMGMDGKYNDGVLGIIDEEEINLILDNEFLWDMSVTDIAGCYSDGMFVLAGENLIKRFGENAVRMLGEVTEKAVDEVAGSGNMAEALTANEDVKRLVEEILKNVQPERLIREDSSPEYRITAVLNLIRYAKSGKTLFKINLKIKEDRDDKGNQISKEICSNDEYVMCKSKRCCYCGNRISKMAGKYEEKIISFIGSPAAGKSAYLAAVIHKLLNSAQSKYGIEVIFDYTSSDYIAFNEACLAPYSKGFAITKTNTGTFPQLTMALKNRITQKTYLYTFVDIPGETFIDKNGLNVGELKRNRKIIKHADVIWYCVSAIQLFQVNNALYDEDEKQKIMNKEMRDLTILGQNTMTFADALFDDGDKKPAVALILTKSDLLSDYVMENVFEGNEQKTQATKQDYFNKICSVPRENPQDFNFSDGEPDTLDCMDGGRLRYQRLINNSKEIVEFIERYGVQNAGTFMRNIATAFGKKNLCPCFSEASYGREPVEKYSPDTAMEFLMAHKEKLRPEDYEKITNMYANKKTDTESTGYIQELYNRMNPIYPFGIMPALEWTFAYTGFTDCVESSDGKNWDMTIPRSGDIFEMLKSRLTLETIGGNIMVNPVETKKPKKKTIFEKIFGK